MEADFSNIESIINSMEGVTMKILLSIEKEFIKIGYRKNTNDVKNILVLRFNDIGDMVVSSGFFRELRYNYPDAHITLITSPHIKDMMELCPYINEILVFDRFSCYNNTFDIIFKKIFKFIQEYNLLQRKYDMSFILRWDKDNEVEMFFAYLCGARNRIGFGVSIYEFQRLTPLRYFATHLCLTRVITTPIGLLSEPEKILYMLENLGLEVKNRNLELYYNDNDIEKAKTLLKNIPPNNKKVLLGIGASNNSKKYPVERYIEAIKVLLDKYDLTFVIVGSNSESTDAALVEKTFPENVCNLCTKTTLRETEAITSMIDIYLGNDTGIMHMATVENKPIIALYKDAKSIDEKYPFMSSPLLFPPYQTRSIILRPEKQLDECQASTIFGGCMHIDTAHCITQIKPKHIIYSFEKIYKELV